MGQGLEQEGLASGQEEELGLRQAEFQEQNLGPAGEAGRRETDPELVISNGKKISNEERFPFGFILMYKKKKVCQNGISHL